MNYFRHLIHSKGSTNLWGRLLMIWRHFGITRARSRHAFERISEISRKYKWTPSFFVTASLLDRHRDLLRKVTANDTHIGLHGYHHLDYALMSYGAQKSDIRKGLEKFRKLGMQTSGFRGPFLRFSGDTARAVTDNDISWLSHSVMLLNHHPHSAFLKRNKAVRHILREYYVQKDHSESPSIPYWGEYCVEIPVSLPDDEMLVDRLGIRDSRKFASIWVDMLHSARKDGELLNLLFHPERIDYVAEPLESILEKAAVYGDVWVAPLNEIARWWQKRATFSFEIVKSDIASYTITPRCSPEASIVLHSPGTEPIMLGDDSAFCIPTAFRPVIGIPEGSSRQDIEHLKNEGFVLEPCGNQLDTAFVLDSSRSLNQRQLLEAIKREARGPLLRYWRWPNRYRSALAITADIDAVTIWDFFRRARHFFRASGHKA